MHSSNQRIDKLFQQAWPRILAGASLLFLLNLAPPVHRGILAMDRAVAICANAPLGRNAALDQALARLNTRAGDALVLGCMGLLFLGHALRGRNSREIVRRLAFWGWAGALCVSTYALQSASEEFLKRPPPFLTFPEITDVQALYGIRLRGGGGSAFPSGHAFAYFFFAFLAWRRYASMSIIIGALGLVMIAARLALGIHWLSDVALGALPLALLMAALARETGLSGSRRWVERAAWRMIRIAWGRRSISRPVRPSRAGQSACSLPENLGGLNRKITFQKRFPRPDKG